MKMFSNIISNGNKGIIPTIKHNNSLTKTSNGKFVKHYIQSRKNKFEILPPSREKLTR